MGIFPALIDALCYQRSRLVSGSEQIFVLGQTFLTGVTCTPWGYEAPKQGYEMRRQNNGYFKLFAKNLFSVLFEIRKHFPKPFLTSAFLNDFLS